MALDARGKGSNYERFDIPIPRDGGITDLLTEAASRGRRFDVVICENIARVARRAFEGLFVERALDQAGVPPFASNEPIALSGSRAQRVLHNPKYTGYQVFNRRATTSKQGKVNGPERWGWSPKPIHEPLIPKWMFGNDTRGTIYYLCWPRKNNRDAATSASTPAASAYAKILCLTP